MTDTSLQDAVSKLRGVRGVFITAMPDCLLYDSWTRPNEQWTGEEVAAHFGDLVRANREALKRLHSWSSDMSVTIESAGVLLVLREIRSDFVATFAFDSNVPLGMVRLQIKQVLSVLNDLLPTVGLEERPRAERVIDFLMRYAPDAHAVLQRVALRSRIPRADLDRPEQLSDSQCESLERAVKEILGIDELNI